jgi:UDP-glucose 4-epimerase
MSNRFLVTGGAGFIGSHLVEALLRDGAAQVVVLDHFRTGSAANLPADARLTTVSADLSTLSDGEMLELVRPADYVFHLAAEKHNQAIDAPDRVLAVNVDATFRLFHAAAAARVRKVVFTSSLYAPGRLTLPPMREDDLPEPRTVYGISKLAGEHLLKHFTALRSTSLRLFFVYGPKQFAGSGYKSVILRNFERILRGDPPVIFGDGRQSLDYVFVDDVVRGLIQALVEAADGHVVNLGSGSAVSVNQLTDLMTEVAGSSLAPVHAEADWTAGSHRVCDNAKARALLGWSPTVPLRAGLQRVYDWMKSAS